MDIVNIVIALLTFFMLILMAIQLFKQSRDTQKSSENIERILVSLKKNTISKIVPYENSLNHNSNKLCVFLKGNLHVIHSNEQEIPYLAGVEFSLNHLHKLIKSYNIENEQVTSLIIDYQKDLQKLRERTLPITIRESVQWISYLEEKGENLYSEIEKVFDNADFSK